MPLPESLGQFPPIHSVPWPANFLVAHDAISTIYRRALRVSNQEDADPLQLAFHHDTISHEAMPLLEAMGNDPVSTELVDWLENTAMLLGRLCSRLSNYHENVRGR